MVIAAAIGVTLIVTGGVLVRSHERRWEQENESAWISGTLSHADQSETIEEPPPRPSIARPPSSAGRGSQGVRAPGYLSISSSPWAELLIDGRAAGTTPRVKIRMAAGRHHLLLVREGFQTHSAWIIVPAGGTIKLTGITLAAITQ